MAGTLRLSQCMIVKNEEKNIRRALSWGKDIMWEQIVVDTGSTDQTVSIARELGAKVFHFQWIDDFAAAKNHAIEKACGDWIVFLDADEYLTPDDTEKLPSLLAQASLRGCDTVAASWIQVSNEKDAIQSQGDSKMEWLSTVKNDGTKSLSLSGTQIRFFCRRPGLCYRGRIHEKLYLNNAVPSCFDATRELSILHTGYSPEELKEKNKAERNIALVKKELERNPHDYQMLTYLGDSCYQQRHYEEAARWYRQAVLYMPKVLDEQNIQSTMVFKHLLLIYLEQSDEKAALDIYERGTGRFPKDADYDYLMGHHQTDMKNFRDGAHYLQKALTLLDRYSCPTSLLLSHNLLLAWDLLILCHLENGDLNQCANCAITMLKAAPFRLETLKYLLMAFCRDEEREKAWKAAQEPDKAQKGSGGAAGSAASASRKAASPSQVMAFLGNLYDLQNEEQLTFVRNAAKEAGYEGLLMVLGS